MFPQVQELAGGRRGFQVRNSPNFSPFRWWVPGECPPTKRSFGAAGHDRHHHPPCRKSAPIRCSGIRFPAVRRPGGRGRCEWAGEGGGAAVRSVADRRRPGYSVARPDIPAERAEGEKPWRRPGAATAPGRGGSRAPAPRAAAGPGRGRPGPAEVRRPEGLPWGARLRGCGGKARMYRRCAEMVSAQDFEGPPGHSPRGCADRSPAAFRVLSNIVRPKALRAPAGERLPRIGRAPIRGSRRARSERVR